MTAFVSCHQLVKAYTVGRHEVVALRGIDFEMARGETVAIIGPSGAGKSSLLNLLGGLDRPTAGRLVVDGQNLLDLKGSRLADYRLRQVGFVWQQVTQNLFGHLSTLHNVTLPIMLAGVPLRARRRRARELLEAVDMSSHLRHKPGQLSGGQQQRVAIAVALANQPRLLLADEPTGSLDRENAEHVLKLMLELRDQFGLTILVVTHDAETAAYADRVLTLRDGALGQDLSEAAPEALTLDAQGRIQLPEAVWGQLAQAPQIGIEVRPEGVLLRPEQAEVGDEQALIRGTLPPDAPPQARRFWRRQHRGEGKQ